MKLRLRRDEWLTVLYCMEQERLKLKDLGEYRNKELEVIMDKIKERYWNT